MSATPLLCPELPAVPSLEVPPDEATLKSLLTLPLHPLRIAGEYFPGTTYLGWARDQLFIYARLEDRDVRSASTGANQALWELGDVFEIFIQVEGQPDYIEFHISPNNHSLQLRFPHGRAIYDCHVSQKSPLELYTLEGRLFNFQALIRPGGWDALVLLPFEAIRPGFFRDGNRSIRASFSRYDYTESAEEPDLSSTSRHEVVNYHRLWEWQPIALVSEKTGE